MTKEEILEAISSNYYGADGFTPGVNVWMVDPEKLAGFLEDLTKKYEKN